MEMAMELTMEVLIPIIVKAIVMILLLAFGRIVLPMMKETIIPWLTDKRLDDIIKRYVEAAEKLAASGQLTTPKKEFVKHMLEQRGVIVTPDIDAGIEAAVIELDHAAAQALFLIHESFAQPPSEPQPTETE